jgi:hypothetical protein
MEAPIDEVFRDLRDRGYTVTESFVEDGSIHVVVNSEPTSYRQLRLLHASVMKFHSRMWTSNAGPSGTSGSSPCQEKKLGPG